jgi:hypothetical protein
MLWTVRFADEFEQEFLALQQGVQDELLATARILAECGPQLGRPYVDTLKGSKHSNMKERRFDAGGGVWMSPRGEGDQMSRTLGEMIAALPKQRRARIDARYREIKEIESLRELRKAAGKAQAEIAATLNQAAISLQDREADRHVSVDSSQLCRNDWRRA